MNSEKKNAGDKFVVVFIGTKSSASADHYNSQPQRAYYGIVKEYNDKVKFLSIDNSVLKEV